KQVGKSSPPRADVIEQFAFPVQRIFASAIEFQPRVTPVSMNSVAHAGFCMREVGGNQVFHCWSARVSHGSLFVGLVDCRVALCAGFVSDESITIYFNRSVG